MELPKGHLSISQIRCYLRCPMEYYFRYIEGIPTPPNGSLALGRAVHKGIEHYFRQKLNTGEGPTLAEVLDAFATSFEQYSQEVDWGHENLGKSKDDGINLLKLYIQEKAHLVIPKAVECQVMIPLAGTYLIGYVDLITEAGDVIDHKMLSRTPPEDRAEHDIRLTCYALAYLTIYGEIPQSVQLNCLVRNKSLKIVTRSATRSLQDINWFNRLTEDVARAIRAGIFYSNPDNFMCTPTACGYWELCHSGREC